MTHVVCLLWGFGLVPSEWLKTIFETADRIQAFWILNPSTQETETGRSLEFDARLIYRVNSKIAMAIHRNPVSRN
jgi:glucan biosynthesis protein